MSEAAPALPGSATSGEDSRAFAAMLAALSFAPPAPPPSSSSSSSGSGVAMAPPAKGGGGRSSGQPLPATAVEWLFDYDGTRATLRWLAHNLRAANVMDPEELARFQQLAATTQPLEGRELDAALASISAHEQEESMESLRSQVQALELAEAKARRRVALAARQRDRLVSLQDQAQRRAAAARQQQLAAAEQRLQRLRDALAERNLELNRLLRELGDSVARLTKLYQQTTTTTGPGGGSDAPPFLYMLSWRPYEQLDDALSQEVQQLVRRQFEEGLPAPAGGDELATNAPELTWLRKGDVTRLLVRGESGDTRSAYFKELARLQAIFPAGERQLLAADMELARAAAENEAVKAQLAKEWQYRRLDDATVQQKSLELEEALARTRSAVRQQLRDVLPPLCHELAELQATAVLLKDYELKTARQDYHQSKQDALLAHLLEQQSRHQLMAAALDLEIDHHQRTHTLLLALSKELEAYTTVLDRRLSTLAATKEQRPAADGASADLALAQVLCGRPAAGAVAAASTATQMPLQTTTALTDSDLIRATLNLAQSLADQQAALLELSERRGSTVQEMERLVRSSNDLLCADAAGNTGGGGGSATAAHPLLSEPALVTTQAALDGTLGALSTAMDSILRERAAKLEAASVGDDRELFALFFNNPDELVARIADLEQRVEARKIA